MAESQILSDFNDNKMMTTHGEQSDFKLPKLANPYSRRNIHSKAEKRHSPQALPSLKKHSTSNQYQQGEFATPKKGIGGDQHNEDFALDIEEKLKHVLENVNHGQNITEDDEDNDDMDFEDRINQNRERIKHQKQKLQQQNHIGNELQSKKNIKTGKSRNPSIKTLHRNDVMQEKRMREFREMSGENKYLQKKKQILALKNDAIQKTKLLSKKREQLQHVTKPLVPARFQSRTKVSPKKQLPKTVVQQSKTAHLFDKIHNFLQHPHKPRDDSLVHRNSKSKIHQLQQKLKLLNQKLGINQYLQTKQTEQYIPVEQRTVRDWRHIQYRKGGQIRCIYQNNFDKEVDRIGTLQQKNEQYLNQYLDHQKTLVELALMKKMYPKIDQKTQ